MKAAELRAKLHGLSRPTVGQCDCGCRQQPHDWSAECVRNEIELGDHGSVSIAVEHLPALVALLEACERRQLVACRSPDAVHAGCWAGYHVAGCPVAKADDDVASAIAAVRAVGGSDG